MTKAELPGWTTVQYTRPDGSHWFRAEPAHFPRGLEQEAIDAAYNKALADTSDDV